MPVSIDWNLMPKPVDVMGRLHEGYQQGRGFRLQRTADNALATLARNPGDPGAISALAAIDPVLSGKLQDQARERQFQSALSGAYDPATGKADPAAVRSAYVGAGDIKGAMDFDAQQAELKKRLTEEQQEQFKIGAKLLKDVKTAPDPEAAYQAAYDARARMGHDMSDIPKTYDPQYVDNVVSIGEKLDPEGVKWVTGDWGAFATDSQGRPMAPGFAPQSPAQTPGASPPTLQVPPQIIADPAAASQAPGDLNSYKSSAYDQIEGPVEQKLGLPPGLLKAIRTKGERSNADQVSPAGARTVYQVIPSTRDLFLKKYGVDAYSTPENAALVAGLHLKESLDRGGDVTRAIREYHGGPNEENWGRQNAAYIDRVGGQQFAANAASPPTPGQAPVMSDLQTQAAAGVIAPGQKPPPGYRQTPEGDLAPIEGGPGDKTRDIEDKRIDRVTDLRKEFQALPEVKEFNNVRSQVQKVKRLAESVPDGSPQRAQADMALIFSFMKALDPNSVVREQEYANAQNSAGVPDRVRNLYNQTLTGQKLNPNQRAGMVRAALDVYVSQAEAYNETARRYHNYFNTFGVSDVGKYAPIAVAGDQGLIPKKGAPRPQSSSAPVQGEIRVLSRKKVR